MLCTYNEVTCSYLQGRVNYILENVSGNLSEFKSISYLACPYNYHKITQSTKLNCSGYIPFDTWLDNRYPLTMYV